MKTIYTKQMRDGRSGEVRFDGKSYFEAFIDGRSVGGGHGVAFIASRGFYAVGSLALTTIEAHELEEAAWANRCTDIDRSQERVNGVWEANRSGDINKFRAGGVL